MKRTFFMLASIIGCAAAASCSLFRTLSAEEIQKRDDYVREAAMQYDDGAYEHAHKWAHMARDIDPSDLKARMIQAWSLYQLGRIDDFEAADRPWPGARNLFMKILEDSPNEFKAKQGLAAIAFREHFLFDGKLRLFLGHEASARKLAQACAAASALTDIDDIAGQRTAINEELDSFARDLRKYAGLPGFLSDPSAHPAAGPAVPRRPGERDASAGEASPAVAGIDLVKEDLLLDEIRHALRQADFPGAAKGFDTLTANARLRREYWEERSVRRLEDALAGYQDLDTRAAAAKNDDTLRMTQRELAFIRIALGEILLTKALRMAEVEARKQLDWDKVPPPERGEVVRSFYLDEARFKSELKPHVQEQFKAAAANLDTFIKLDERRELARAERVEHNEGVINTQDDNVFLRDIVNRFSYEMSSVIQEDRSYRRVTVLLLLTLYIFPVYGMQDLDRAEIWATTLHAMDERDPVYYLVRATILEKRGDLKEAAREYNTFLAHSSVVADAGRREYVRSRLAAIGEPE